MFNNNVEPLENLIDQFAQFPGIGRKSAVRMAYQVMSMPPKQAMELAKAIEHAKSDLHRCRICQDYTTGDVCKICASQKRDRSIICVVEGPRDIKSIERTHEYNGLYHVLHGLLDPLAGVGAEQLTVKELLARLRVTFRRISMLQNAAGCSVFTNGDLQIDFAAGCATLKGQELHLTPIEYRLLCVMAKNCGKVLTHTYITHEVWGSSWDNDVASLRVFMATLRKKLESEPDSPQYIQTHIGIGYRMLKV